MRSKFCREKRQSGAQKGKQDEVEGVENEIVAERLVPVGRDYLGDSCDWVHTSPATGP
jgi:hypothetical protein